MSVAINIILPIAIALLALVAAYLVNQLPEIRKFPGKLWLLGRLTIWVTLLAVVAQVFVESKGADVSEIWRYGGVALLVALAFDSWTLISVWRGWHLANEKPADASNLRERLLTEHHRTVRQRLDYAVGEQALINVVMRSQPAAVDKPGKEKAVFLNPVEVPQQRWSFFKFLPGRKTQDIAPAETILETFEHEDIGGRLLILGAPGSGKTTTLLKLADALLERAKGTEQIPYIFELSAWREDQQSIADWLMAQLKFDYSIAPAVSKQWLTNGQLLPLLDGLDELEPKRQKLCVDRINEFVREMSGVPVVVCCREKEYEKVAVTLSALNGALCLQPLDDGQIQTYFEDMERPDIWDAIQQEAALNALLKEPTDRTSLDEEAAEAPPLRIPLLLQILAVAYDASEQRITSKADLFDAYILHRLALETRRWDRQNVSLKATEKGWAYAQPSKEPELLKTQQYLSWLAQQLKTNDSTNNFLIEQMQPSWLETKLQKWQYRLRADL